MTVCKLMVRAERSRLTASTSSRAGVLATAHRSASPGCLAAAFRARPAHLPALGSPVRR